MYIDQKRRAAQHSHKIFMHRYGKSESDQLEGMTNVALAHLISQSRDVNRVNQKAITKSTEVRVFDR